MSDIVTRLLREKHAAKASHATPKAAKTNVESKQEKVKVSREAANEIKPVNKLSATHCWHAHAQNSTPSKV